MITKFKIFENNKSEYNENDYIGKFCIVQSDDDDVKMSILQCNRVDFPTKSNINIFVSFDCFDIDYDNNISLPVGDNNSLSIEDFKKIIFMTPIEFYNSNKDICEKLYYKIIEDLKDAEIKYWHRIILKNYKKELDKIPDFKFFADSDKFNI